MGATDSKLTFKKSIFRLSENGHIAIDDPFWAAFWELPETTEDVSTLFSHADLRRTRDHYFANLQVLILAVTSRLFELRDHPSFPDPDVAPERHALNCIRILTRLLPFLYEADHLEQWDDKFFWRQRAGKSKGKRNGKPEVLFDSRQEQEERVVGSEDDQERDRPLGEELIDTLIDMLFYAGFTVPKSFDGKTKITYAIWQSGVGCHTSLPTSKEFESNRCELLRLLVTIASKSMYLPANTLTVKGTQALTYLVTCPEKQVVLSVLCSLLNTTLKYNPASWRVPYDHVVFKDSRQVLVNYSLQLILILVLYPVPDNPSGVGKKNYYRHFLGRLHRPQDFQFLVDGMTRVLNQPVQANSSYLPGSQKSIQWAPEMIMLFWEILQCNKNFRSFIVGTDRAHDFLILILFYALEQREDLSKQGVVRMCVFVLQSLSAEARFGQGLKKKFEGQATLPASVRLDGFRGTYGDYLIMSLYTLLTNDQGKLQAIYPAMLAIINNVAPYLQQLSMAASVKLMQLFASMSAPSFLLANETNHELLSALLESLNAIIEHQYSSNPNFILALLRSRKRFEALRQFTLESGQAEIERQSRQRKDHGKDASHSAHSPIDACRQRSSLQDVPEESSAFAIGDDEDSDDGSKPTTTSPSTQNSRQASVSSSMDDTVPLQLRGMSEKARGKLPAGSPSFQRQNSSTTLGRSNTLSSSEGGFRPTPDWVESWVPELPLHTILTLISELAPQLPSHGASRASNHSADLQVIQQVHIRGIDPSPVRIHLFEWSPLSLGWYESLLWGFIFASEIGMSKGAVGTWNGTAIKLFKVQEVAAAGPSLLAPRGAVDAVGSNLVQRIGSLNFRNNPGATTGTGAGTSTNAREESTREGGGGQAGPGRPSREGVV